MDQIFNRLSHPILAQIIEHLPADVPVFLVGGAVRDALLNRPSYDFDFATAGDALKMARAIADSLGAAYFPLDKKRKVARLIFKYHEKPGEAPVGESEAEVSHNHLLRVDFSSFQGENLQADLEGRDFTMNAMALDVRDPKTIIDPFGGAPDLRAKRLRACSQRTFEDDPVRILRAVRFSVALELSIDKETLSQLKNAIPKIPSVSSERIRDELFRLLLQSHPATSLRLLDQLNALEQALPEICVLKDVQQSPPHTMDVWNHTLSLLSNLEMLLQVLAAEYDPDRAGNLTLGLASVKLGRYRMKISEHLGNALNPERPHRGLLFLAGLYHDVGKKRTQTMDDTGRIRFFEHEHIGKGLIEQRGKALRLSNLEVDRLVTIVGHHMRPSLLSHESGSISRRSIYRFFRDTGAAGIDICLLSLADVLATYGPTLSIDRWTRHLDIVRLLMDAWWEDHAKSVLPPAIVNGDDIMRVFKLSPGPQIGFILEEIREAQVAGEIKNRQQAMDMAKVLVAENKKMGG